MPVRYNENDLKLRRLKDCLLNRIRQLEEERIVTTDSVKLLERRMDTEVKRVR